MIFDNRDSESSETVAGGALLVPTRVHARTHFELAADLLVPEGQTPREVFDATIQLILDWFSESFQRTIPDPVRRHEDFGWSAPAVLSLKAS